MKAKGIVACGHIETARAAAAVLDDGGNAFDAALAAMCAACVAEPVLASLGGGGFLLARQAEAGPAGAPVVFDFFGQTPKSRTAAADIDYAPILADFGPTRQEFHIGMGSIATPGVVRGLFAAHRALGRMPIREVVAPAIALARRGVEATPMQAYMARVVGAILRRSPEAFALQASPARPEELVAAGETYRLPELADVLEILAIEGDDLFYRGEIAGRMIADSKSLGGHLDAADLRAYQVERRRPIAVDIFASRLYLNPPPSSGGILIAFALELMRDFPFAGCRRGSPAYVVALARAMAATNRLRIDARLHEVADAEVERVVLDAQLLARYRRFVAGAPAGRSATTHISVADAAGNAASLSISNGEGSGYVIPGTGIMLNNMLGEDDINPHGHHGWPLDRRMSSMMTPVIGIDAGGGIVALGSGGSNRIRTAILQVLLDIFALGGSLDAAIAAPRLHVEDRKLSLEPGFAETAAAALEEEFDCDAWSGKNMFFGGVHAVRRAESGPFSGAADERRDGAVLAV
ncbi:MAG: gamma-glutamyltransferase [Rhodospirillales bacterium]|nr:gamma-glutamyltransferase [Rhodospirillales bacterium]